MYVDVPMRNFDISRIVLLYGVFPVTLEYAQVCHDIQTLFPDGCKIPVIHVVSEVML